MKYPVTPCLRSGKYLFEYGIFFLLYLMLIFSGLDFKQAGLFTVFLVLIGLLMFSLTHRLSTHLADLWDCLIRRF